MARPDAGGGGRRRQPRGRSCRFRQGQGAGGGKGEGGEGRGRAPPSGPRVRAPQPGRRARRFRSAAANVGAGRGGRAGNGLAFRPPGQAPRGGSGRRRGAEPLWRGDRGNSDPFRTVAALPRGAPGTRLAPRVGRSASLGGARRGVAAALRSCGWSQRTRSRRLRPLFLFGGKIWMSEHRLAVAVSLEPAAPCHLVPAPAGLGSGRRGLSYRVPPSRVSFIQHDRMSTVCTRAESGAGDPVLQNTALAFKMLSVLYLDHLRGLHPQQKLCNHLRPQGLCDCLTGSTLGAHCVRSMMPRTQSAKRRSQRSRKW